MENLPSRATNSAPSLQERASHREWIGGAVFTLLQHYWRPDDPLEVTAAIAKDWVDILEPFPQAALEHARKSYLQAQPNRRPTPADIRNRAAAWVQHNVPKRAAGQEPQRLAAPERKPVDAETAQRLMAEAGFTAEKMDLVKRFPSAPSMQAIERIREEAPPARHWTEMADPDGPEMRALRAARDANPLIRASRAAQREAEEARRAE